ncbi:hypothetical protein MKX03_001909, partial [Papaver bracteatum]
MENLTLSSSSTEPSSSPCSVIDKVISDIDLLTHILVCLPDKSLLVFKSVSKQWLSLISDPIFAITRFRRQKPKTTGLFLSLHDFLENYYDYSYDFLLLDGSEYEKGYIRKEMEDCLLFDGNEYEQGCIGKEMEDFLLLDGSECQQGYVGEEKEVTDGGGGFKIPRKFGDDPEPGKYGSVGEYHYRISQSCNGLLCCTRQTEVEAEIDDDLDSYKIDGHFDW